MELIVGEWHGCARTTAGAVWCWGKNGWGQRGHGGPELAQQTPTQVPLAAPAVALSGGNRHTCALLADQRMFCWGALPQVQTAIAGHLCKGWIFDREYWCVHGPSLMAPPNG